MIGEIALGIGLALLIVAGVMLGAPATVVPPELLYRSDRQRERSTR